MWIWKETKIEEETVFLAPWQISLIIALTLVIIFLVLRYTHHLRLRKKQKKKVEKLRFESSIKRLQKQLAMDFHDEMGNRIARLVSITNALMLREIPEIQQEITTLNTVSRDLFKDVRTFIWSLNPENVTIAGVFVHLKETAYDIFKGSELIVAFEESIHSPNLTMQSHQARQLLLMIKEIFTNALKHSEASHLSICFEQKSHRLNIMLHDNGKGINRERLRSHNQGLKNLKTRASSIGLTIKIHSKSGTRITISGPIRASNSTGR